MIMKIGDFGVYGAAAPACADLGANEERFECYKDSRGRNLCQYDYRDFDGKLFSCVKATLQMCVEARDKWVLEKEGNKL